MSEGAGSDWPSAVETLNESGRSPIVLVCEHASNFMPAEYRSLGLAPAELSRHIAWDIGAAELTRRLSALLDAPAFLGTYSRLLIDLNRPPASRSSIPVRSEATAIPGNVELTASEISRRRRRIFEPFQARLAAHVAHRSATGRRTVVLAIHSFTPVFLGQTRPWHVGVLFDKSAPLAEAIMAGLSRDPSHNIGANVPYSISPDDDYAVLVYGDDVNNPAVLIEMRHDLIADSEGVARWATRLSTVFSTALASLGLDGGYC